MNLTKEHISGFVNGDHNAFEILVVTYRHNAINFAKRYVRDIYICEDIVQEAFASAYVYRDKYNPQMPFKTWLFTTKIINF